MHDRNFEQMSEMTDLAEIFPSSQTKIKLTPLKVLIESLTPDYFKAVEEYEEEAKQAASMNIKAPPKPRGKEPEYKTKWYNLNNYDIDSWSSDWDDGNECPIIIVIWYHIPSESMTIMNVQMKESEWIKLLEELDYIH